jgi:hypothetical protein
VEASNIKDIGSSGTKLAGEIAESMEMSTSISVMLSSNDTLTTKKCQVVINGPCIKIAALCVGKEDITSLELKLLRRHESDLAN